MLRQDEFFMNSSTIVFSKQEYTSICTTANNATTLCFEKTSTICLKRNISTHLPYFIYFLRKRWITFFLKTILLFGVLTVEHRRSFLEIRYVLLLECQKFSKRHWPIVLTIHSKLAENKRIINYSTVKMYW